MRSNTFCAVVASAALTAAAAAFGAARADAAAPVVPVHGAPTAVAVSNEPPPIFVGGNVVHERAFMEGSHVLVPVRGVFEALHAVVFYTPPRIVVVRKDGAVIAGLVVDRNSAVVNNKPHLLSVAPVRHGGRIYVPLRAIAEIAGADVAYSTNPRLVDIRLPNGLRAVPPAAVPDSGPPPDGGPPLWALGVVGTVMFAFAGECLRRLVLLVGAKRTRAPR